MSTLGQASFLVQEPLPSVMWALSKAQEAWGQQPTAVGLVTGNGFVMSPVRTEQ